MGSYGYGYTTLFPCTKNPAECFRANDVAAVVGLEIESLSTVRFLFFVPIQQRDEGMGKDKVELRKGGWLDSSASLLCEWIAVRRLLIV